MLLYFLITNFAISVNLQNYFAFLLLFYSIIKEYLYFLLPYFKFIKYLQIALCFKIVDKPQPFF